MVRANFAHFLHTNFDTNLSHRYIYTYSTVSNTRVTVETSTRVLGSAPKYCVGQSRQRPGRPTSTCWRRASMKTIFVSRLWSGHRYCMEGTMSLQVAEAGMSRAQRPMEMLSLPFSDIPNSAMPLTQPTSHPSANLLVKMSKMSFPSLRTIGHISDAMTCITLIMMLTRTYVISGCFHIDNSGKPSAYLTNCLTLTSRPITMRSLYSLPDTWQISLHHSSEDWWSRTRPSTTALKILRSLWCHSVCHTCADSLSNALQIHLAAVPHACHCSSSNILRAPTTTLPRALR